MSLEGYESLMRRFAAIEHGVATPALMTALGTAAVAEQKTLFRPHTKTGTTSRSIRIGAVTPSSVETRVGFGGPFVERGTRAHVITPRAAKALAWAAGGAGGQFRRLSGNTRKGVGRGDVTFARRVHHPGTTADPFMVPGAKRALEGAGIAKYIVELWDHAR